MSQRSVQHATIALERVLDAPLERIFAAWVDPAPWDVPGDGWENHYEEHEFRVGGWKRMTFGPRGARIYREEGRYEDIVPGKRILYAYSVWRGDVHITVSLSTVEFLGRGARTQVFVTEQLAILDEGDTPQGREAGIAEALDKLAAALKRS